MRTLVAPLHVLFVLLVLLPGLAGAEAAGGLAWTAPKAWKVEAERPMRAATYKIAAQKGDADDAECAVFYFGRGQGGTVEQNVQRWAAQFEGGKAPTTKKEKAGALDVTTLELEGTYTGGGGPMGAKVTKPGYRLLGAIVDGPEGAIFFKLTGPSKTVQAARADFLKMAKGIAKR